MDGKMSLQRALDRLEVVVNSSHLPGWKDNREAWSVLVAHLTQSAQSVDVGAIREVIGDLRGWDKRYHGLHELADNLTCAIGNSQAEGWRLIETAPRGSRKVIVLISNAGPSGYVTDPWTGWIESDGKVARWPHPFPPTHWMPLPTLPTKYQG